jgi:hypothetical protein
MALIDQSKIFFRLSGGFGTARRYSMGRALIGKAENQSRRPLGVLRECGFHAGKP